LQYHLEQHFYQVLPLEVHVLPDLLLSPRTLFCLEIRGEEERGEEEREEGREEGRGVGWERGKKRTSLLSFMVYKVVTLSS
jgi:hypothetical protein